MFLCYEGSEGMAPGSSQAPSGLCFLWAPGACVPSAEEEAQRLSWDGSSKRSGATALLAQKSAPPALLFFKWLRSAHPTALERTPKVTSQVPRAGMAGIVGRGGVAWGLSQDRFKDEETKFRARQELCQEGESQGLDTDAQLQSQSSFYTQCSLNVDTQRQWDAYTNYSGLGPQLNVDTK